MLNGRVKIKCYQKVLWDTDNIKPFQRSGTRTHIGHISTTDRNNPTMTL